MLVFNITSLRKPTDIVYKTFRANNKWDWNATNSSSVIIIGVSSVKWLSYVIKVLQEAWIKKVFENGEQLDKLFAHFLC